MVLASPSVVPAVLGPSPLAAKVVAGHGAGMSENPGRDARMPPGRKDGFPGWPGCRPGAWRPRAIRAGTDAGPGSSSGDRAL